MTATPSYRFRPLATLAAVALLAACADRTPAGPDARSAGQALAATLTPAEAEAAAFGRLPDLSSCPQVRVPEGSKLSFHVFGIGVQIYRWSGTRWEFVAPDAKLYADAAGNGLVGTHFGGPTWLTLSGSRVVGTVTDHCTPDPDAIDWLRLDAAVDGSGVFEQTKLIQRVNTVGGKAPSAPGTSVGQEARVPYTADYFFYRAP